MKNFWPHRSEATGFSIEKLASKYREKISSVSSNKKSNQIFNDIKFNSFQGRPSMVFKAPLSRRRGHWANRDFSEYKEAA